MNAAPSSRVKLSTRLDGQQSMRSVGRDSRESRLLSRRRGALVKLDEHSELGEAEKVSLLTLFTSHE